MAWYLYMSLALVFAFLLWRYSESGLKSVPGPSIWSLFLQMYKSSGKINHVLFMKWAKDYGPIFKVKLGLKNAVVLNNYDCIYEALVKRGKDNAGRGASSYRMKAIGFYPYSITFTDMENDHIVIRKAIHIALKAYGQGLGRIEEFTNQQTEGLLDSLKSLNGQPENPKLFLRAAASKMTVLLTFGEHIESEDLNEWFRLTDLVHYLVSPGFDVEILDLMPWLRYFGLGTEITQVNTIMDAFWHRLYINKKDTRILNNSENKSILETMHHFGKENPKHTPISEKHMRAVVMESIVAGGVTTSSTLYALFNILLHYPNIQSKMYSEIKNVIGDKRVSYGDRDKLPYIRATILELHRYASVVPLGIPHMAVRDTEIQGYKIPKGTMIITNLAALHHDESFWNHPEIFRPERFLDDEENLLPIDHPHIGHVKPFGAGVRMCIGENVAAVRLFIWLVSILQKIEVQGEPSVSCHISNYIGGIVVIPKPYKIKFVKRYN